MPLYMPWLLPFPDEEGLDAADKMQILTGLHITPQVVEPIVYLGKLFTIPKRNTFFSTSKRSTFFTIPERSTFFNIGDR